ncbi:unnamed protein product [Rotaria sordida]|uniref:F-box domain-containing protein n=1 Tax=Rotaria sordida TaxID=392033 RepID=A0A815M4G4_9BILA|nr:unnamed protein product [Rotaria sordida]
MNRYDTQFLDLPDEILLIILKKLNNIDVLYSFLNINNQRLNIIAQEKIFTNILNFTSIDNISSNDCLKLDRFCTADLIKRILLATNYPNLTKLKIFNFKEEIVLYYFTNESPLRYIFQQQITDLILVNSDKHNMIESIPNYTRNVYAYILSFCKNLKHLSVIETSYPRLLLCDLPSTTFFSSILTYLCINVTTFDDCLYLLDGRLHQLTTLIVELYSIHSSTISHNMDNLRNLKCFSLKSYWLIVSYDYTILPLLRRMSCLEKLTLYLRIDDRNRFIDDTHLENEILVYMPWLHSFTFYICTYMNVVDLQHNISNKDIQQTFTNIKQQPIANTLHSIHGNKIVYSILSISFEFDHLEDIGNTFPNIKCSYVTYLLIQDVVPFDHQFFIRISQNFPLIMNLRIMNIYSQSSLNLNMFATENNQLYATAVYPRLISLDIFCAHHDYVEEFLNEKKTYVPCLTQLRVVYNDLRIVTKNFTREETRRNCANIKRLILITQLAHTKDFYLYFPLL